MSKKAYIVKFHYQAVGLRILSDTGYHVALVIQPVEMFLRNRSCLLHLVWQFNWLPMPLA